MNRNEYMEQLFREAENGWQAWTKIDREFITGNKCAVFFNMLKEEKYIDEVKIWLPEFIDRKGFSDVIVYSDEKLICDKDTDMLKGINYCEGDLKSGQQIFRFYKLCRFTQYVYVLSLDEPFGNANMFGYEGIQFSDWLRNWG